MFFNCCDQIQTGVFFSLLSFRSRVYLCHYHHLCVFFSPKFELLRYLFEFHDNWYRLVYK